MRTSLRPPPARVDPAVAALRQVAAVSARLSEALEALDEAGGLGRAVQSGGGRLPIRRTVGEVKEARDGLTVLLGRMAGLVRDGVVEG